MVPTPNRVSVIVTTYNLSSYLGEAIQSILDQKGVQTEVIVVDDASTDDSAGALRPFWSKITYIRLRDNRGGPAAPRNLGIRASTGGFIAILDGDDIMLPGKLAEQVEFLNRYPEVPLVFTDFRNFDDSKEYGNFLADHVAFQAMPKSSIGNGQYCLSSASAYETLIGDNFIGTSGVVFRKSLIEQVGGFDETLKRSEDFDFWLRVARRSDLGYIDRVFHRRRLHGQNISSDPSALTDHLAILERQMSFPLSKEARNTWTRVTAQTLFSIGYSHRLRRHRFAAAGYFLRSMLRRSNGFRPLLSIARLFLPLRDRN